MVKLFYNPLVLFWRMTRRYPVLPGIILVLFVIAAIIGPTIAPYQRDNGDSANNFLSPFSSSRVPVEELDAFEVPRYGLWPAGFYLLGTDQIGRDIFTRLLHGAQISMLVVFVSLTSGMLLGTALGLISGYYGGVVDEIITRFVDIWYALPFLLIALVVTILFGRGLGILMIVLALIAWAAFVRVIRSEVLVLKGLDYVASARVNGASDLRIMLRHLLPGILNTAVVVATLNTSGLILSESVLSFVGAGIPPPTPAWGVMTNDGRNFLNSSPHLVLIPGGAIFLVVLALNFLGDWLRDKLDPRLRQLA